MKNLVLFIIALLTLTACGKQERVYTTKEFTYDEALIDSTLKKCSENRAEAKNDPNCINASSAHSLITLVLVERGCYEKGTNTKECIDKYWAE